MNRTMFRSKIHRATVTMSELYYEGSITVDKDLLDAADILPYEKVQVVNLNTGSRLEDLCQQLCSPHSRVLT